MIYAYRRTWDAIELFVSETDRQPPPGFIACSWPRFRRAWQLQSARRVYGVRPKLPPLLLP